MSVSTYFYETYMLTGFENKDDSDMPEIVRLFLRGHFEEVLESDIARSVLAGSPDLEVSPLRAVIQQNVQQLCESQDGREDDRSLQVLIVAAASLQLFIQNNWLGPPTLKSPLEFCHHSFPARAREVEIEALEELSLDGESVYTKSRHLLYLYIAKLVLLNYQSHFTNIQTWDWWLLRCLLVQQTLLPEKSPTLKETVLQLIENISKKEPVMTDDANRDLQILFHVEAGYACHIYFMYRQAADHFETAREIADIQVKLTGALGKRTHYQQKDTAQLVVQVERKNNWDNSRGWADRESTCLPKNLALDDETVMNDIKFVDNSVLACPNLSPYEQVLIMGLMESYRRSQAQDRLTDEEVITYVSFILSRTNIWSLAVAALNLRSRLEKDSRRRVERSMMQLEELVKVVTTPDCQPHVCHRLPLFYASHPPPVWTIQKDLASILLSLGCTGSALDIYEKLELWEDVIACYQKLGKREKAESLIRERLALQETPALLCCLGDVSRDLAAYQRAWELSGQRNARSMRCMGYIYFQEQQFEQAIECFATSLKINSLQISVWFTYGCAAMACQKYDVGAQAFRKCVSIDYDNFEAWSNLATCYVKLQQKKKAFATLQDAIKCNYENWRLWENSLIIGTDCGEFENVIQSYHRLMDLKEKWVDVEVLGILTTAVLGKIPDADGVSAERLAGKLLELFGRVTAQSTSDGDIWAHYARLTRVQVGDRQPDLDKTLQLLQKSYRCLTQKTDWEKDIKACHKIADLAVQLVQVHFQCCQGKGEQESLRLLSSAKLTVNGALAKIKKHYTDPVTQELSSEVVDPCHKMEELFSSVVSRIESIRNALNV